MFTWPTPPGNSVDNTTVVPGSGTAMEHHWDEAFGLFGVPVNFPVSTVGLRYLGSYSNQVDAGLHCNTTLMNAFLKGRAAISAKDLASKQQQAALIIKTLDQLDAAAIVQEMKETDANIEAGDAVAAYGTLSESLGFVRNLKYYLPARPPGLSPMPQIAQLLALYDPVNPDTSPNLYNFCRCQCEYKGPDRSQDRRHPAIHRLKGLWIHRDPTDRTVIYHQPECPGGRSGSTLLI